MNFKTKEQEIVVKARIEMGYEAHELSNGDWLVYKGRHTMQINCLGYDCYVSKGNFA